MSSTYFFTVATACCVFNSFLQRDPSLLCLLQISSLCPLDIRSLIDFFALRKIILILLIPSAPPPSPPKKKKKKKRKEKKEDEGKRDFRVEGLIGKLSELGM